MDAKFSRSFSGKWKSIEGETLVVRVAAILEELDKLEFPQCIANCFSCVKLYLSYFVYTSRPCNVLIFFMKKKIEVKSFYRRVIRTTQQYFLFSPVQVSI